MNGMRMLRPERATRWNRPRRSMTMTSAWPMILKEAAPTTNTIITTAPKKARRKGVMRREACWRTRLRSPVGDEQVDVARLRIGAARGPDQLSAVRAERREPVEPRIEGDLLEARAVHADQIQIEVTASRVFVVRREDDLPAVERPRRAEVRASQTRDLALVTPVGVHDPELHPARAHDPLCEEVPVVLEFAGGGGVVGAIDDLPAVGRPPRPAVVARLVRELADVGPIHVHRIDVEVPVLERREHDPATVGREHAFGGVDAVVREALQ